MEEKYLPLNVTTEQACFTSNQIVNTYEQLNDLLVQYRSKYVPFMKNYAPTIKNDIKIRTNLENFGWRIGTREDELNFIDTLSGKGNWTKVSIPHYGGPLGKAVTYYQTQFDISEQQYTTGALFVCFGGVDYKATVFINGSFVGMHEGFFAPFEFDITQYAMQGVNTLLIKVENDFICMGNETENSNGAKFSGDKIYAATGVGYDDSEFGWHHCPPGMGIYQDVYIEARPRTFIKDIFVRPMDNLEDAEVWVELYHTDIQPIDIKLELSIYGRNFDEIVLDKMTFSPNSTICFGLGDSLTEARMKENGTLNSTKPVLMGKGLNKLVMPVKIKNARVWKPESPWLYQVQVCLQTQEQVLDTKQSHFGMRTFKMDTENVPKGMMYLNDKPMRLRGANTMGHEQQCVVKKDWEQLIDDILLAKICNMNFLRFTQRPVQSEIYDYCDMLGLMAQTDLPLFAVLSRSQFCEAIRQAEEMEKMVRRHPSNILITYINEPFPNAGNKPNRNLTRSELEEFFKAADIVVHLNNPDRVIKYVDGDYDPPSSSFPDNHCYPAWYNGHGIEIGKLHKGYWMYVKPNWYYGCGEFGAEGLDPLDIMQKYYPKEWLSENKEKGEKWSPNQIRYAQTGSFHYFFYDTPDTMENWIKESHKHQAWATKIMTEAFRRDSRMVSFAIHLFIDAFPSGWMKSIMDVERKPKLAYFAYRDALQPLMANIRTDRFKYFDDEEIKLEAWICNDNADAPNNATLCYLVEMDNNIIHTGECKAGISECNSKFQGFIRFKAPKVNERKTLTVRLGILDTNKAVLNDATLDIEVFPKNELKKELKCCVVGNDNGVAQKLAKELKANILNSEEILMQNAIIPDVIFVDDTTTFYLYEEKIMNMVQNGAKLALLELEPGNYEIAGFYISVRSAGMLPLNFVSRNTSHKIVKGFKSDDFKMWYDEQAGYITPILESTFDAETFNPILTSGNVNSNGEWKTKTVVAEKKFGCGSIIILQIKLAGRIDANPIADMFVSRLFLDE